MKAGVYGVVAVAAMVVAGWLLQRWRTAREEAALVEVTKCPARAVTPPRGEISASDFVSLERAGCFGACPDYKVKVFGDGRVMWTGRAFVEVAGEREAAIPATAAAALIRRFQTRETWTLCGSYRRQVTDAATTITQVHLGGRVQSVTDYAEASPRWFRDLQDAVDEVANTHLFRHGDPRTESIYNQELLPKPGMNELMRAAFERNEKRVRELIARGVPLEAVDASGWTAMMHAAGSESLLALFLAKGANARHVSLNGDTMLMFYSKYGIFCKALAAGDVNAQNHDGVSVLMILASLPKEGQLAAAIKAGARIDLRDKQGRAAIDYLEAARCGNPLLKQEPGLNRWGVRQRAECEESPGYAEARGLLAVP